ncbi:alpha-galactosidase [Actinoplanes tereljensis]|uniref:Alpha-galactosidase n=1 Tax=Paractinoplanes tereljensis TaxID=571912 RepID=A0A919NVY0_9ACTN|nr:NPCBM/NEW2 domain-containing protein [Actinoplanes tereljensis]GIF26281.1 alpha-galactosidase [Actinoplanes tereljensis]
MHRLLSALLVATAVAVAPASPALALDDGLARTPPMGFNDWNAFGCDVTEDLIKQTADLFITEGLRDAGYTYLNIDDCWSLKDRDSAGRLVPDPVKFPSGIAGTAAYVHSKGLKLGIYSDAGTNTCAGYPGSLGRETLDAQTFADWGVDYLKYDNCYNQSDGSQADYIRRYTAMRDALAATGRPIVLSICEWGSSQPWTWGADVGHLWRTTGDISDNWPSLKSIIAANAPLAEFAGPGHWNDPDMLEIGNGGMTATEYRTHMSMWAMMAAPLIIGTDLRSASAETLGILTNREIIGIDQDRLGVAGRVVSDANGLMVLDKPLAGGEHAIALYNSTDVLATIGTPVSRPHRLTDVWTGAVTQARSRIEAAVPAHGTVVYKVKPIRDTGPIAPAVTVGGAIETVTPAAGTPLATTVTNRGVGSLADVRVTVAGPAGWTVTANTTARDRSLGSDESLVTTWTVTAPATVTAGSYPLTLSTAYTWGGRHRSSSASTLVAAVVTPPAGGSRHLSTVRAADFTGSIALDQTVAGNLITIGDHVYTRGIGTTPPTSIRYYVGGECSSLTTDVGGSGFTVYADDTVAASSTAAQSLTADLTGAAWLRLTTTGTGPADWAEPVLTCGEPGPVQPAERTLFSFEGGTDGFGIANAGGGGSVEPATAFHTDGTAGLLVHTPVNGNWFGKALDAPLDLTGFSHLKFDMRVETAGSVGEIAVQVGDAFTWCQGGQWTWTNPGGSRTVSRSFGDISCPAGVTLDPADIRAVWVFLNTGGDVSIDNIRAE